MSPERARHTDLRIVPVIVGIESYSNNYSIMIEVKTGSFASGELKGIGEFVRRHPKYRPLVVCDERARPVVERTGLE